MDLARLYADGDPSPYFGPLNLFGPLPATDVGEAGAPDPTAAVPVTPIAPAREG